MTRLGYEVFAMIFYNGFEIHVGVAGVFVSYESIKCYVARSQLRRVAASSEKKMKSPSMEISYLKPSYQWLGLLECLSPFSGLSSSFFCFLFTSVVPGLILTEAGGFFTAKEKMLLPLSDGQSSCGSAVWSLRCCLARQKPPFSIQIMCSSTKFSGNSPCGVGKYPFFD